MGTVYAFVDESGNTNVDLTKDGVSQYFIVTAVIVHSDLDDVRKRAEAIRLKHFQTGEMKSSSVGSKDARRLKILADLVDLPISTYALAIEKKEIEPESGLRFSKSFFKYVNKMLYEKVFRLYEHVSLVADEHGRESYMESFKTYMDTQLKPDLFMRREFRFEKSHNEVLLQVADFFSGSLGRILDASRTCEHDPSLKELLAKVSLGIDLWPPNVRGLEAPAPELTSAGQRLDDLVRRHCLRQVVVFLEKHRDAKIGPEDELRAQMELLKYLTFKLQFDSDKKFASTGEILDRLQSRAGITLTVHKLRSAVVSKLRDANVVLASGANGYKIPVSVADVAKYVAHVDSVVSPMLSRLRRARRDLLMATFKEVDILEGEALAGIRCLCEADPEGTLALTSV
jgi:hypothetical protein